MKEVGQIDCIYKYDPKQNVLSKTENIIPFKNVKFQNEKNFYLINKMSDLEEDKYIKYKEKEKPDNNGMKEEKEEDKDKKEENKGKIKTREFAIFDSNNQIHIIKSDTFEHFSNEYIPIQ